MPSQTLIAPASQNPQPVASSGGGNVLAQFGKGLLGAIPFIGQGLQSIFNAQQVESNQKRQNEANLELAKYQYSKDLEMWNRANLYNAPSGQMERLKAAGLNPNMVYSGGGATMAAAQLPKFQAPTYQFSAPPGVDIPAMLSAYQDYQLRSAQISNTQAQAAERSRALAILEEPYMEEQTRMGQAEPGGIAPVEMVLTRYPSLRKYLAEKRAEQQGGEARRKGSQAYGELPQTQSDVARKHIQQMDRAIELINANIRYRDKQIEWYAGEQWAKIFGIGAGAVSKMGNFLGRGAKGKLSPGTIPRNSMGRIDEGWLYRNGYK